MYYAPVYCMYVGVLVQQQFDHLHVSFTRCEVQGCSAVIIIIRGLEPVSQQSLHLLMFHTHDFSLRYTHTCTLKFQVLSDRHVDIHLA